MAQFGKEPEYHANYNANVYPHVSNPPTERASMMHVLVVDDDAAIRTAVSDIARNLGYAVSSVDDANGAAPHSRRTWPTSCCWI